MTEVKTNINTDKAIIDRLFQLQQSHKIDMRLTSASERKRLLKKLLDAMYDFRSEFHEALYKDYKKPPSEVDLTEIYPVIKEIKHARKNVHRWMRDQKVSTPLALSGSSSYIHYESKGAVLIIAPWNFPVNLTLCPLISAIAAGNTVIIKPSEFTPHTSKVLRKVIETVFEEQQVAIVEGEAETAKHLTSLPFNHIFFTGSPAVGRLVMAAAAKNLASVTLELGGKSPTIVDDTADVDLAAKRIAWAKFMNNGQICIAPDYILVDQKVKDKFVSAMKKHLDSFYGNVEESESYGRIVNKKQHARLSSYITDAEQKGAEILVGGNTGQGNFIAPTLFESVTDDMELMQNEIFGPLLPIKTFSKLDEVVKEINDGEIPLAMYVYSRSKKNIKYLIDRTTAGGTCINHNGIHFFNSNLPFGGSNNSGIGKSHGYFGFEAFSNRRSVLKQNFPGALELLVPPFNDFKKKIIDLTLKYF